MHTMVIVVFFVAAIAAAWSLNKAAAGQQPAVEYVDLEVLSHARAAAALRAARDERRHTRAHCVSATSGRAIAVDLLSVNTDGTLQLRRRGHPHAVPFDRPASAMFSR